MLAEIILPETTYIPYDLMNTKLIVKGVIYEHQEEKRDQIRWKKKRMNDTPIHWKEEKRGWNINWSVDTTRA